MTAAETACIRQGYREASIAALHEAGHAVVAAYLRVPFSRVTIKPTANSSGHVTPIYRRYRGYDDFRMKVLQRASKRFPADAIVWNEEAIVDRTGPAVQWSITGVPYVSHWSTYDGVSLEQFDELIAFLIDYALKVSEAYIPLAIRQTISV